MASATRQKLCILSRNNPPRKNINYNEGAVLLVRKPFGWSSFKVINTLRPILGIKKMGHSGTLDPRADGLLIICSGKATKSVTEFQELPKTYRATITFGASTPSYDLETPFDQKADWRHLNKATIEEALKNHFKGTVTQKPPIYSAIKKDGVRLYMLARSGKTTDIPKRRVTFYNIDIVRCDLPDLEVKVTCSKGTYIRSMAHDLGKAVGSLAHLSALTRTAIGKYKNEDALTIEYLKETFS